MPTNKRTWRRSLAVTTAATSLLLSSIAVGATSAGAAPAASGSNPLSIKSAEKKLVNKKLVGGLAELRTGARAVFVEFAGQGAADASADSIKKGQGKVAAKAASKARKAAAKKTSSAVVDQAKAEDSKTKVLFQVSNAVPGVGIVATKEALTALAKRSDVVKISPIVPKKASNASAAQLTKALNTWIDAGNTGEGVKIGIIDTGIDYTHADFGGVGTVAAWDAAHAYPASPFTPTAKVVGGYDFVGDTYNADPAAGAGFQPIPQPDSNPLDCNGHGSHVSGTAAGYGVTAAGATFSGDYSTLTGPSLYDMKIGPGMAPKASLYGLKVFGCEGSTDVVIPAMDWALDPNGDGDFSDHLDIVNLSLGSDYGVADDPENDVVDKLAQNGVLPVIAMGNNGDLTDTGGSPGNAVGSLAVASSVDEFQLRDGLKVNAPADVVGIVAGQDSVAYPWATAPDVTGTVVTLSAANADGCAALSAEDAAKVAGKVAWLEWDDNDATRACGSVGRSGNVAAAGAIGAIFTSKLDVFGAGITGSATIPVIQLPKAGTDKLRASATAGTLNVTFSGSLKSTIKDVTPSITDTISSFTSRGTHGAPGIVKPDVAAVGDTVASVGMGSGNDVLVESGTSMATPVTAGIAALVKKKHPTWTAEQIKAAIMNTAGNDLYTGPSKTGLKYGPARVGAGRIDALAAVNTKVLAYNTDVAGGVSVSFGVVEAPITKTRVTETQNIRVQNTDSAPVTVKLAYEGLNNQPGVTYTVSPSTLTIKPSGSANVTVTMTITSKSLRKNIDKTMAVTQTDAYVGIDRRRQFVADGSGRVTVTPTGGVPLRVPVYGAAKPVSKTHIGDTKIKGKPAITIKGTGFNQGVGGAKFDSKLSAVNLGFSSRKLPTCSISVTTGCTSSASTKSGDIQYVGANATTGANGSKANGWLWFGVSTFGNWATVGNSLIPFVDMDTNGDGTPDYEVYVQNEPSTDLLTAYLIDIASGELLDVNPVNFVDAESDTNVFDTNTVLIPVWPAAIGVENSSKSFVIDYSVGTFSPLATSDSGNIDQTPTIPFDVVTPNVKIAGPLYADKAGVAIPYKLQATKAKLTRAQKAKLAANKNKVLIFHLQGASGGPRTEIVKLKG